MEMFITIFKANVSCFIIHLLSGSIMDRHALMQYEYASLYFQDFPGKCF